MTACRQFAAHALERLVARAAVQHLDTFGNGRADARYALQRSLPNELMQRPRKTAQACRCPHISLGPVWIAGLEDRAAADLFQQIGNLVCISPRHAGQTLGSPPECPRNLAAVTNLHVCPPGARLPAATR
jgi:hypothetical protein